MTTMQITRTIDARATPFPGPLMSLIGAIREAQVNDMIEVLSSDQGSRTDILAWVLKAGHELSELVEEDGYTMFVVRKAR